MAVFDRDKIRKFSRLTTDNMMINRIQDEIKRSLDYLIDYVRGEEWRVVGDPGEPGYANDWASNNADGTALYDGVKFKRVGNVVHIMGLAVDGTVSPSDSGTIFTLPVGYRPDTYRFMPSISRSGGSILRALVDITPEGKVRADEGGSTWFSVECSFEL